MIKQLPKLIQLSVLLVVTVWILYMFGRIIYKNYSIQKQITELENSSDELTAQNDALINLLNYFKTNSYIEREARAEFGLKRPGEVVIAVPTGDSASFATNSMQKKSVGPSGPPYQSWWNLFFKS